MNNQVLQGDALEVLKTLPSALVDCCVTSPPYFRTERLWDREMGGGRPRVRSRRDDMWYERKKHTRAERISARY